MAKDKFKDLDKEVQDKVASMDTDSIKTFIVQTVDAQSELMAAREKDLDWLSKKEELATANEVYKDGTKGNKLKVEFALRVLADRGIKV
jgi:hypothetical protein